MEKIDSKIISSEAAKSALFFGLISGGYIFITGLLTSGFLASLASVVLWAGKFVGCILLMRFFMKKLLGSFEGVGKRELVRFGTLIALFSAIITAACSYICVQYVFPDQIAQTMDVFYQSYASMLDSNSMAAMQNVESKIGLISMVSNFAWCFFYGWILSLIMAGNLAGKSSIFDDDDI